jgi:multicomponent K+:H+ antiporter subunit C
MEALLASAIGALTAAGLYLVLRQRTFPVILGLALLSYAVNVFLFVSGRLAVNMPPVLSDTAAGYTDPLPQALVLTAIVISFGMSAVVVMLALGAFLSARSDRIDIDDAAQDDAAQDGAAQDGAAV